MGGGISGGFDSEFGSGIGDGISGGFGSEFGSGIGGGISGGFGYGTFHMLMNTASNRSNQNS